MWRAVRRSQAQPRTQADPRAAIETRSVAPARELSELRFQFLAGVDQALHGVRGLGELLLLRSGEFEFDDALDAFLADHGRHADIEILDTVGTIDIGRAGQHALLVFEKTLGHRDRRCRWSIIG